MPISPFSNFFSHLLPAACCLSLLTFTAVPGHAGGEETAVSATQNQAESLKMKTLSTSVFYRERMLLPPGSTLTVTLEDVSKMDVAADIITFTTLNDIKSPPYSVNLQYDQGRIKERMRYGVRARIENGGQLLFINTKHVNPFAGDPEKPVEILVQKVGSKEKGSTAADASLENTYWKLMKLSGRKVQIGADDKELYMVLTTNENRVRGYAGCNGFTGSYSAEQNKLNFSQVASTMRMCTKAMEQEQAFLRILGEIAGFSISGETLTLFDEGGQPVAEFESRYMH